MSNVIFWFSVAFSLVLSACGDYEAGKAYAAAVAVMAFVGAKMEERNNVSS